MSHYRRGRHGLTTFLALVVVAGALLVFLGAPRPPARASLAAWRSAGAGHDVRILRDSYGVPHVFGKTDADAAFGLAYAQAEDDFATVQEALLASRGRLATLRGRDGAANDYMVGLLRVQEIVEKGYRVQLSPDVRAVCEAYAEGLNLYASEHPAQVLPYTFPVRGQDIVAGFVHKLPLFFGLERTLRDLFGPARVGALSAPGAVTTALADNDPLPYGSNAFAAGPAKTGDGATRLLVNSHQPWDGPVAWYEAHVHSEEGWDMTGGTFPGAPVVLLGANPDLGWAHTVNRPDLIDVFVLETNPRNPNQYRFDGAWRDFEVRPVPIVIKLWGPLRFTSRQQALWSLYGPVVRQPHGVYAIRFAGIGGIRAVEQWFRMNKARTRAAWEEAMHLQSVPMFNTVYADAKGNVGYVYNARLPRRTEGYDWSQVLPGDSSRTLWTDIVPYDELPQVWNPPSGAVISCNNSPFTTTPGDGNPDPARFPKSLGIETQLTNRSRRALELFGADTPVSREVFDRYKLDNRYSSESNLARRLAFLVAGPPPQNPLAREAVELLKRWDLGTDAANPAAALALQVFRPRDNDAYAPISRDELVVRVEQVARGMMETYGRLDVPFGEAHRLRRGTLDLPIDGGPDTLRAVYTRPAKDGRLVGWAGDSYVLSAEWDAAGAFQARSIHQFGSATSDPSSPHYADQSALFAAGQWKPVWMSEAEVRTHLEREYRPGR